MENNLSGEKQLLRQRMLGLLKGELSTGSSFIGTELAPLVQNFFCLLAYFPLPGEIDPRPLFRTFRENGRPVFLPRITGPGQLTFHQFLEGSELVRDQRYGIQEPPEDWPLMPEPTSRSPGLVLVPGLAFTESGQRLGRGKGFYDRLLASLPTGWQFVGMAHEFQVLTHVPTDNWDQHLHFLLTPGNLRPTQKSS